MACAARSSWGPKDPNTPYSTPYIIYKAISLQSGVITSHLGVGVALARPFSIFWIKLVVMSLSVKRQGRCSNLWEHGHKFDPFLMSFGGLRWRLGHFLMIFVEVRLS